MSINISVHGSPISIRRRKLFISDIETLKKSEINRRRRVRLEQVRQQSKDIASDIRQRVRGETVNHLNDFEKKQRAEQEKQRSQKLRDLQQQYQDCLEEVGTGHLQASLEPNPEVILEAERERNRTLAEERGKDAAAKLRQDLADAEVKKSATRNQQKFARTLEDLRSAVIVSLGKKSPKRTPKKKRIKKRKPLSELSKNIPSTDPSVSRVVPPPPPKAWTLTFDKNEHMHYDIVDEDVTNTQQATTSTATTSSSSSSTALAVGDILAPSTSKSTPAFQDEMEDVSDSIYTDNRETTDQVPAELELSSPSPCSSTRKSSVKSQPSKVRFYDHTSKHECEYDHCALVERVVPNASEADAAQAAEVESQSCRAVPGPPPYECTYARGQRALARERLHRDYKQLLGDLHNLAREERLIKCTRDFCLPPEVFYEDYRRKEMDDRRQRNMDSAFEKIYHGTLTDTSSMSPAGTCAMQDMHPHWQPAALDSPATLNVADYQRLSPAPTLNVGTAAAQSSATTEPQNTEAMSSEPTIADSGIRHSSQVQDPNAKRLPSEVDVAGTSGQIYPGVVAPPVSENLDELMQRVNAQQAKLMEEIKMYSETPDTLRHIPELGSSIGRPMEEMSHASDLQKRSLASPKHGEVQELSKGSDHPNYSVGTKPSDFCEMMKQSVKNNGTTKSIKMTKSLSTCVCKKRGKGKKEGKKSTKENPVHLADDDDTLNESDDQVKELLSEYSYEHSIVESSVESNVSGSTSYEGMKIVVSVSSEFTQERYQPSHSPMSKKAISISASPQKFPSCHHNCKKKCKHRHYKMPGLVKGLDVDKESADKTSRKSPDSQRAESEKGLHIKKAKSPNKRRHKTPEKLPTVPEKEADVERDMKERAPSKQRKQERSTRIVKEKATMTSETVFSEDLEANAENINSALEDSKTNGERKWQQVFEKSTSSGRNTTQSTSYMSPPEELISSNIKYLSTLLSAIKDSQNRKDCIGKEIDPKLVHYISRLLSMSRESIENLGVSSSDVSTPDIESSSLGSSCRMDGSRTNRRVQTILHPDASSNAMDALLHSVKQKTKSTCTAPCSRRVPGTSTPEENETQQTDSRNEGYPYEVETPPFSSRVADMTLDEYKAQKFPELFSDYSERCTRRISSLSRKIEEIRDEQRKLMNSLSGNSSSSSSSSSGKEGLDSTKYMSPPESSTVMTQVKRKDNVRPLESVKLRSQTSSTRAGKKNLPSQTSGHRGSYLHHIKDRLGESVPPQLTDQGLGSAESLYSTPPESDIVVENGNEQANGITTATQSAVQKDSSHSQYYSPVASCNDGLNLSANENATGSQTQQDPGPVTEVNQTMKSSAAQARGVCGPCAPNCNKNNCFAGRSISKETRQHTRPPSTLLRHNAQSIAEDRLIKELSTIIEGDSTFASPGSNSERRQSADHTSSSVSDDSVPDVLSEMYRRGLITSPLNLPEIGEDSSMTTSSSPSSNEVSLVSPKNLRNSDVNMNNDQQVGFLTYIGNRSEEISQMLVDKFKNLFKGDSFSFKVIEVFSVLGINLSPFQVELGFRLLGLMWDSSDKNLEVHPYFSSLNVDATSENFRKQVLEAFKGLNEDSSLEELEAAFCKIGIICPGGVLRRINTNKLADVTNSSGSTELSTSTGTALLPMLLSISTEDLSTTEDEKNAS